VVLATWPLREGDNVFQITLHWASKTRDPFAKTTAVLWVKCKRHQLNDKAAGLVKLYGADSVSY
jgi:hypothetical protein